MSWKKTPAPSEFPESLLWAENRSGCSQFREGKIPALVAVGRSTLNDRAMRISSAKNILLLGLYKQPPNNWSSGKLTKVEGENVKIFFLSTHSAAQ